MSSILDSHTERKKGFYPSFAKEKKNQPSWKELLPETADVKKAKEVLNLLAKAFTSMRIYPSENPSVKSFINALDEKMKAFLDEHDELKLTVQEFSFSFKEEKVFQDEHKKASLPFLFFKDGMRELVFTRGLEKVELQDFLKILKDSADLPPDDCDVVNSLWIKDFPHIRHFAVDEFLDSDIGEETGNPNIKTDPEEFSQGKIELSSVDKEEFRKRTVALGLNSADSEETENKEDISLEDIPLPFQMSTSQEEEFSDLESMIEENRSAPPLTEMICLLFEILYLEDRIDAFSSILNVLNQFYKEIVYKSLFVLASLILNRLQELVELFSGQHEEKREYLEKILRHIKSESSFAYLKKLFMNGQIDDFDSFFRYLNLVGPNAIPLVADIWEEAKDPLLRSKASDFLCETGKEDIHLLLEIVKDHRIPLTQEVIRILGKIGDPKALPFLETYTSHRDKRVRISVIHALGNINDERTNSLMLDFLFDRDGEVRTRAAMGLKHCQDQTTISYLIQIAENKDFRKRLKEEKKILLEYLAETRSEEVSALLRSILRKWSILKRNKQMETRLCAVPALEKMANEDAQKILKEGTRLRNRTIRMACELAMRKIAQNFNPNETLTGGQNA